MAGSSTGFHEAEATLAPATRDMHRAIISLMEELEAVDWYQQRMDAAGDGELKEILRHNRDEETVPGPYEAVLSPNRYYAYVAAANRGYPVPRHTKGVIAEVHRSLVMQDGGALFSTRGGDFILTVGGDLAVGYRSHDRDALHLFCVETLAPQTVSADAVCLLEGNGSSA
jgi:hypothetical protein